MVNDVWPSIFDVSPTSYKCYTNDLCLLGLYTFFDILEVPVEKEIVAASHMPVYPNLCCLFYIVIVITF